MYLCLHVGCLHLIAFSRLLHRFIYIECLGNLSVAFCFFRSMLVVLLKLFFIGGQVFSAGGCKVTKIFVCKPFFRLLDIWWQLTALQELRGPFGFKDIKLEMNMQCRSHKQTRPLTGTRLIKCFRRWDGTWEWMIRMLPLYWCQRKLDTIQT